MRLTNTSIVVALLFSFLSSAAYADLDSPTYARAREAYEKGDCNEALPLLKKYEGEDNRFLADNPNISSVLKDAGDYCEAILFPSMPGTSYPTGPPQQPDLPVNLANAFDTEARLKGVIDELQRGKPDYDLIEPMLGIAIQRHMAAWVNRLQALGPLVSIDFEGEQQNADLYEVKFKNGTAAWMIGIAPNGRIDTLIFQW